MARILIWRQIILESDIDIFSKTDYTRIASRVYKIFGKGNCPNWGNRLWFQGICSAIDTPENEIHFRTNESNDEINELYDLIIYPMANFFSIEYCSNTTELVESLRGIHIPIYIIACGAQAKDEDSINELVMKIGDPASRFIETVYQTGGEFALRGYITKSFFEKLGFSSAVVTGCPSIFQLGRNLSIAKKGDDNIKPILNGKFTHFSQIMHAVPTAQFFSQDQYFGYLYDPEMEIKKSFLDDVRFWKHHGNLAEWLTQGRIKMIINMNDWYHYIRNEKFNFSFGTKIHGSIMPILAGIPAMLLAIDSRTQEMAEFFDIPYQRFDEKHNYTESDLEKCYIDADYTKFNKSFADRFDVYERFLRDHGIVTSINEDNRFFSESPSTDFLTYAPNREKLSALAERLEAKSPMLNLANTVIRVLQRIES